VRHRAVLLLAGLLAGGFPALAAPAVSAPGGPAGAAGSAVSARLAPPVVTIGEPSVLVAQVAPVTAGRDLSVQVLESGAWTTLGTAQTDATGRYLLPLDTSVPGVRSLRVVASRQGSLPRVVSAVVTSKVYSSASCSPKLAPVDPAATPEAVCLAARLDRWRAARLMAVGQQLNVSNQDYLTPLTDLADLRVGVVGFDLEELAAGETYQFANPPLQNLLRLAQEGAVLTASWHARNPHTSGPATDRSWHDLGALLDASTPQAQAFWADFDAKLELFRRLQTGDEGAYPPAAVVFRPFHEANGAFFWWGKPDPTTYRRVWATMQARAWAAGVHNILWAYSFNLHTSGVRDPATLVPRHVDLAGLDSYDPEGAGNGADRYSLDGYAEVHRKVARMTITEAGPHGSLDGSWNPAAITRKVRHEGVTPAWAMLWFDDSTGKKQISSLSGGRAWLRSCPNGYCYLG